MSDALLATISAVVAAVAVIATQIRIIIELVRGNRTAQATHAVLLGKGVKVDGNSGGNGQDGNG